MANITKLTFPEYLTDPAFENRMFTLNVLKPATFTGGTKEALAKALERVKEIPVLDDTKSPNDAQEASQNLSTNHKARDTGETIFTIVLPLPNTFTDSQSHSWSTEKGIVGEAGGAVENSGISEVLPSAISNAMGSAGDKIKSFTPGAISNGAGAFGSYSIGKSLGNLADQGGFRKPLVDPGYFQNYNGSEPREFAFSFDLIPSSKYEAKTIIDIIMKLKEYASPSMMAGGVSILAPYYFDIVVANKFISSMAGLNGVVIKSINIDYGADGAMQFTSDGIPKYIKLDLTVVERKMKTASDYRRG